MLGLLGTALARITVPVTDLVLDPSRQTSPFRPHQGRLNLAPGLVVVAIAAEAATLSLEVRAYLLIAAGAAFMARVVEALIGRRILRAEILALAGSSLFSGTGLVLVSAARLGAPFLETSAWHLALMGGLGLGRLAVFSIASLRHTGRQLGLRCMHALRSPALLSQRFCASCPTWLWRRIRRVPPTSCQRCSGPQPTCYGSLPTGHIYRTGMKMQHARAEHTASVGMQEGCRNRVRRHHFHWPSPRFACLSRFPLRDTTTPEPSDIAARLSASPNT